MGLLLWSLKEGKKIEIVKNAPDKQFAGKVIGINSKNIYKTKGKEAKDLKVKESIEATFKDHPAYGHRRLSIELGMNKKRVRRIMKKYGLKPPRLWYQKKYITEAHNQYQNEFTNLVTNIEDGNIKVNQVWSSDLTYIKFKGEFIYLSAIKDIASHEVVGAEIGSHHDADLVLQTLKQALLKEKTLPEIFHSDRGREFLNEKCIGFFRDNNVQISVSNAGSPWQNCYIESFWSRFKAESGDLNRFENLGELIEYIYDYINYYNKDRIINKLKTSPYKYKQKLIQSY